MNFNYFRVSDGAVCAILGLGTVGISTIMACRDAGAMKVSKINDKILESEYINLQC